MKQAGQNHPHISIPPLFPLPPPQCRRISAGRASGYSHRLFRPPSWIRKTVESWGEVKILAPIFSQSPANPKWRLNNRTTKTACTAGYPIYELKIYLSQWKIMIILYFSVDTDWSQFRQFLLITISLTWNHSTHLFVTVPLPSKTLSDEAKHFLVQPCLSQIQASRDTAAEIHLSSLV